MGNKFRAVVTSSVMQKVIDLGASTTKKKYLAMLSACASDGEFNSLEKQVLLDYAQNHGIDRTTHLDCLSKIGWTEEEYIKGIKNSTGKFSEPLWRKTLSKFRKIASKSEIYNNA